MKEVEFQIEDINEANLQDIPESCRCCVYWEFPEKFEKVKDKKTNEQERSELEKKKREWFVQVLKEFGTCGKIIYHKGKAVAYAQFAPSERLPKTRSYESKPVGKLEEGIVFLTCLFITDDKFRQSGLNEALLRNVIDELRRRGFRGVETFARRGEPDNPSGPLEFYIKNGFIIKDKTDDEFPLMQLLL